VEKNWLGPPGVPYVEVVNVSVTPDQLFAAGGDCRRLTTAVETSECKLSIRFDYGHSTTDRRYSADLVFTLRAACPESVGQGCTDENDASISPGHQVTWTSSIRLTTTGCDPQCIGALLGGHPGDGGVAGSPDQPAPPAQPSSDQPAPPTQPSADQPAPPADQPTVAGPESIPGGG
jgi:hypothetical protein